jgi:hypothetical protein
MPVARAPVSSPPSSPFAQNDAKAARTQWRQVADQLPLLSYTTPKGTIPAIEIAQLVPAASRLLLQSHYLFADRFGRPSGGCGWPRPPPSGGALNAR